jgi:hypothetical protein
VPRAVPYVSVLIVSRNEETARHLQHYFESRSLDVKVTSRLSAVKSKAKPTAFVVFPDEFSKEDTETELLRIFRHYPEASMTVVTADTQRFVELGNQLDEGSHHRWFVLPRPAFSWTIFDHVVAPCTAFDRTRDT